MCDFIWGDTKVDISKFIAQKRQKLGLDTGIDPRVMLEMAGVSQENNINLTEQRSVGSVSGMSSIMKRSEDNYNRPVG